MKAVIQQFGKPLQSKRHSELAVYWKRGVALASFPGLPRFFCYSVSVDNNTRMRKGGPSASVYYC